jgi:hypothetical protein
MLERFLETYGNLQDKKDIPLTDLEQIKSEVPDELFQVLQSGEGSFMNGFLWIVNPKEYKVLTDDLYNPVHPPAICFARDAFGSLFLWEGNAIIYVDVNNSKQEVIGKKINVFFNLKLTDSGFLDERTSYTEFLKAKMSLGEIKDDECFGYFPLIGMGGSSRIENLKKVKIKEYLSIVAQSLGKIY